MQTTLRRLAVGLLLPFVLLLALAGSATAQKGKSGLDPRGEPKGFHKGQTVRYALWHDQHGWHLRTTTAMKEHVFKGHIVVEDGTFEKVHSFDLEKEGKLADHWKLGPKRHELTFDFKTDTGIDGINFTISKSAKRIRFVLHIDGKSEPERVYVGHGNQHPVGIPFTLPAHPSRK